MKTDRRCTAFTLIGFLVAALSAQGVLASGNRSSVEALLPEIRIHVYSPTTVSSWVREEAQTEAVRILRQLPVRMTWLDCNSPAFSAACASPLPTDLILRILQNALPQASTKTLGIAGSSEGYKVAFIFYARLIALRAHDRSMPTMLGRVMAHEIIHLLMPGEPHSRYGLMRATWTVHDLEAMSSVCLSRPMYLRAGIEGRARITK